jgi:hypothetical protein
VNRDGAIRIHCLSHSLLLAVLGFELKASHFLGRCSTTWVMSAAYFCSGYSQTGFHFLPRLARTTILLFYISYPREDGRYATMPPIGWEGVLKPFCLGWPQTTILPMSASQVTGIAGMSYQGPVSHLFLLWHLGTLTEHLELKEIPAHYYSSSNNKQPNNWAPPNVRIHNGL